MFDSGVRSATDAIIALALGATAVGIGRPYAYALSYGGAESLTHYLRSFLAELDLCLAVCGFKDVATLKGRVSNRSSTLGHFFRVEPINGINVMKMVSAESPR
jgi:isopentenyl diphosphate isomerase/L-lactate dehydrogenase-like FMN-dependent dehydrogenase